MQKITWGDTIIVDFSRAFDSIHREKMEQILLANSLSKETVTAITMLYKNTKVKVRSPDGDTDYFDIVASVPEGDTFAPYLFIICQDDVLRMSIDLMKENGFTLKKAKTFTDVDYADDIALPANTSTQAKSLLHSLEKGVCGIDRHVNTDKTEVWFGFSVLMAYQPL